MKKRFQVFKSKRNATCKDFRYLKVKETPLAKISSISKKKKATCKDFKYFKVAALQWFAL